jgi:Common central domain of tyrosinase/Polyphenol oxidase middle domain
MSDAISRRCFLSSAGITVASVAVSSLHAQPSLKQKAASRKAIGVRRDVTDMADDDPVIKSYRKAVAAMKALPPTDPLSWTFQANTHGAKADEGDKPDWRWCMHSNWWFLPWHRGYLYFFERIIKKKSDDDEFWLPYWPWEKPGQDVLPAAFRSPGQQDDLNPLYDGTRYRGVNAGKPIRQQGPMKGTFAADWERAARIAEFTTSFVATSYGGLRVKQTTLPQHPDSQDFGQMESLAHNAVHVCVAPEEGNMADPDTAARDPIFWLHHANVDRLWNRWLDTKGHYNPEEAEWAGQKFPFYDEGGKQVVVSVSEILDLARDSYRYNDDHVAAFAELPRPVKKGNRVSSVESRVAGTLPLLALDTTPFLKPLPFDMDAKPRLVQALANAPPPDTARPTVVLRVENIQPPAKANVMYEVFVTKAGQQAATKYYLGPITFFGRGPDHGHGAEGKKGFTQAFDATEVLQNIRRENKNELPELQVAIVPHSTDPEMSDEELARKRIQIPISNVTLRLIEEEKR